MFCTHHQKKINAKVRENKLFICTTCKKKADTWRVEGKMR